MITVGCVVYNGVKLLKECVDAIHAQTYKGEIELLFLDNASTDNSREEIERIVPGAVIVASDHNGGFSYGHNTLIKRASGKYYLPLNQDAFLDPDYIARCIDFLEKNEDYAAVSGVFYRAEISEAGGLTSWVKTGRVDTCGIRVYPWHQSEDRRSIPSAGSDGVSREIFGVNGAAAVFRIAALHDVSFTVDGSMQILDETFFMYKEDLDLAYRLRWRGWKAATLLTAQGFHIRSKRAWIRKSSLINFWSYRNHWYFLIKNIHGALFWVLGWCIVVYEGGKFVYSCVVEPASLRAIPEIVSHATMMRKRGNELYARRKISSWDMVKMVLFK